MNDWKSASLKAFMFSCYKMMSYKTYKFFQGPSEPDRTGGQGAVLKRGVKNWSKLLMDSTKNCHHGEGGCLKSEKIADVVYGWSPRWRSHTAFGRCVNPIAITEAYYTSPGFLHLPMALFCTVCRKV